MRRASQASLCSVNSRPYTYESGEPCVRGGTDQDQGAGVCATGHGGCLNPGLSQNQDGAVPFSPTSLDRNKTCTGPEAPWGCLVYGTEDHSVSSSPAKSGAGLSVVIAPQKEWSRKGSSLENPISSLGNLDRWLSTLTAHQSHLKNFEKPCCRGSAPTC